MRRTVKIEVIRRNLSHRTLHWSWKLQYIKHSMPISLVQVFLMNPISVFQKVTSGFRLASKRYSKALKRMTVKSLKKQMPNFWGKTTEKYPKSIFYVWILWLTLKSSKVFGDLIKNVAHHIGERKKVIKIFGNTSQFRLVPHIIRVFSVA